MYEPTHRKTTTKPAEVNTSDAGAVSAAAPCVPALDPRFLRGDRGSRNKSLARMDAWAEKERDRVETEPSAAAKSMAVLIHAAWEIEGVSVEERERRIAALETSFCDCPADCAFAGGPHIR